MARQDIPQTGLWGAISDTLDANYTELYTDFQTTGWASYIDTQYTVGSPFVVAANTDTLLPNNAGSVVDVQKPADITTFWNQGTQKITGRDGDSLAIQFYFKATSSAPDQWLDIWIDIGGSIGELYRDTKTFPKGSGTERGIVYALPAAYTLDTWQSNGGSIYVRSNATCNIYDINFNFKRAHKAR